MAGIQNFEIKGKAGHQGNIWLGGNRCPRESMARPQANNGGAMPGHQDLRTPIPGPREFNAQWLGGWVVAR